MENSMYGIEKLIGKIEEETEKGKE